MRYIAIILFVFLLNPMIHGQATDINWPVFRGSGDLSGNTRHEMTANPSFLWSLPTGVRTISSPVLSDGVIYFGNSKGTLYAINETGKIIWSLETGKTIEAPPLVFGDKVYVGSSDGVFRAINKLN